MLAVSSSSAPAPTLLLPSAPPPEAPEAEGDDPSPAAVGPGPNRTRCCCLKYAMASAHFVSHTSPKTWYSLSRRFLASKLTVSAAEISLELRLRTSSSSSSVVAGLLASGSAAASEEGTTTVESADPGPDPEPPASPAGMTVSPVLLPPLLLVDEDVPLEELEDSAKKKSLHYYQK